MRHRVGSLEIVPVEAMTVDGEPYQARRPWRERLFTRPWRPWRATKTACPQVPDPCALRCGHILYIHPEKIRELLGRIQEN